MIRARPDPRVVDGRYLRYLFASSYGRSRMATIATRTAVSGIKGSSLAKLVIRIPSLATQHRVADALDSFDLLIENNRRRAEVLEEMARAIYREWFVHFRFPGHEDATFTDSDVGSIPEGWKRQRLSALAKVNPQSRTPVAGEVVRYLDISCLGDRTLDQPQPVSGEDAPGRARRVVAAGDVVWSMVRPNRRAHALLVRPGSDWIASTGTAVLRPEAVTSSYLFEVVSSQEFTDYLVSRARGSAYPAAKVQDFKDAIIVQPRPEVVSQFTATVGPLHRMIWTLREQSAGLGSTRDLLLPKLVTGQIDVSDLHLGANTEQAVA